MAVLLADRWLHVHRADRAATDGHGYTVLAPTADPASESAPGRASQAADLTWTLGVDPNLWPIEAGDTVGDDAGQEWIVVTADLIVNNADPTVDYIRVVAHDRYAGGTRP